MDLARRNEIAPGAVMNYNLSLPYGTTFPRSPKNGDLFFYQVSVGQLWALRYATNGDTTYPWEVVGGSPVYDFLSSPRQNLSAGISVAYAGDNRPQVTAPLAGVYDVFISMSGFSNTGGGSFYHEAYNVTASTTLTSQWASTNTNTLPFDFCNSQRFTIPAAAVIRNRYTADASNTCGIDKRLLQIMPVRVAGA